MPSDMQTSADVTPSRSRLTLVCVVLIATWVATGAVFKLFWGTPALLPRPVIATGEWLGLELGLTYKLTIGLELAIVALALTRPRLGWWCLAAILVVFDVVLTSQIKEGETSCGCFGSGFSPSPKVMLTIDSVLLLALLAARPWSSAGPGLPLSVPVVLGALGLALPWFHDRELKPTITKDGEELDLSGSAYMVLDVEDWVGQEIWDTPLGQPPLNAYIDVASLPLDGLWVFYRQTCDHCAKHLAKLAESEHGERLITLVQLEEPNDTLANRVVNAMPDGNFVQHARLPPSISYMLQTPAELVLEGGKVVSATEGVGVE
jgi:methylamine utilization protein MauE